MTSLVAFCDGAAKGNPGPGGWGCVVRHGDGTIEEAGGGATRATNNQMEMDAAIQALGRLADEPGELTICTDSSYLIQGITAWIHGWKRKGWKTAAGEPVLNQDRWEALDRLVRGRAAKVHWQHVPGHAGVPGNERVDAIASGYAEGRAPALFRGAAADYGVDLDTIRPAAGAAGSRKSGASASRKGGKAHSYLSLVGGRLERHRTWAECEARVKGRSGARYRKAMSAAEERDIARSWGVVLD
jgi:ribonuclease HI